MIRKKYIIQLISSLFLYFNITLADAQEDRYEKIKTIKIAYITEQLNLTPAEAEVFWPVYNDFENRRNKLREERKKIMDHFKDNSESMSDDEIKKTLDDYIASFTAENDLSIQYNNKLVEILLPEKTMKLHLAEIQFRYHLIEQLRQQRHNQGQRDK